MNKKKIILRIIVSPFVLGLISVSYILAIFTRWIGFIKWGGEFINYDKDEIITIQSIYEEVKNEHNKSKEPPLAYEYHNHKTGHCFVDYDLNGAIPKGIENIKDYVKIPLFKV